MTHPNPEYLTKAEHEVIALTGKIYTLVRDEIAGHDRTRDEDLAEIQVHLSAIQAHVHAIQHAAMGQAAGRLYPGQYRLLGEVLPDL